MEDVEEFNGGGENGSPIDVNIRFNIHPRENWEYQQMQNYIQKNQVLDP